MPSWLLVLAAHAVPACKCHESGSTTIQSDKDFAATIASMVDVNVVPKVADPKNSADWIEQLHKLHQGLKPVAFFDQFRDKPRTAQEIQEQGLQIRNHVPFSFEVPRNWGEVADSDPNWHFNVNAWRPLKEPLEGYRLTGDRASLKLVRQVIFDWIDYNLVRNQKNEKKWYDMSAGLRAEKLGFVIDDGLRNNSLNEEEILLLMDAAQRHAAYLSDAANIAKGNHAFFMLAGLAALCHQVPELVECPKHLKYVDSELMALLQRQFSPDGVHLEGAPGYHLMLIRTFESLLESHVFGENAEVERILTSARELLPHFYDPSGRLVMIGDSEAEPVQEVASFGPSFRFLISNGNQGQPPSNADKALTNAGYFVYRSPWDQKPLSEHSFLFFSTGGRVSPHSHLDDFTFEWSELGHPIIVDSGKFSYKGGIWRNFFRSTRAGNTVEIDGKDHSPKPYGSRLVAHGSSGPLYFAAAGIKRERSGVDHRRVIVGKPRSWLCVVDLLESDERHAYRQWFGADTEYSAKDLGKYLLLSGEKTLPTVVAEVLDTDGVSVELRKGIAGKRPQGWLSREYDKKVPRYSFAFRQDGENVHFVTLLSLQGRAKSSQVEVDQDRLKVRWTTSAGASEGFTYEKGKVTPLD